MRRAWQCPDLDLPPSEDQGPIPVPGTEVLFDCCPAFFLRDRLCELPAPFLIDGLWHPAEIVAPFANEIEVGSRKHDELAPRVAELARIMERERMKRSRYEMDQNQAKNRTETHG